MPSPEYVAVRAGPCELGPPLAIRLMRSTLWNPRARLCLIVDAGLSFLQWLFGIPFAALSLLCVILHEREEVLVAERAVGHSYDSLVQVVVLRFEPMAALAHE